MYATSWSPLGDRFAYTRVDLASGNDIWIFSIDGDPFPFRTSDASENHARFSPDGEWLAYGSDEWGRRRSTSVRRLVRPRYSDGAS